MLIAMHDRALYRTIGGLAVLGVLAGQVMLASYDDDHQSAINSLLPVGIALTAIGLLLLAILALTWIAGSLGRAADDDPPR
jgi:protein-S-isoprenylcysteine O-methyltransferase Ste14